MSREKIIQANETHLKALAPDFATAWENVNFKPPALAPFQAPTHLFAEPDNRGSKDSPYLQRGIFTVTLAYPTNQGGGAAQAKANDISEHFKRGTTINAGDFNVIIERTPEITGGVIEGDRYIKRVRIRFFAHIDGD
jgi:hypothetical protein